MMLTACKLHTKTDHALGRYCMSAADVADDYISSVTQKNPKQKLETLRLLRDVVGTSSKKDAAKAAAALVQTLAKVAGEPAPDIREAALQVRTRHAMLWLPLGASCCRGVMITDSLISDSIKVIQMRPSQKPAKTLSGFLCPAAASWHDDGWLFL